MMLVIGRILLYYTIFLKDQPLIFINLEVVKEILKTMFVKIDYA